MATAKDLIVKPIKSADAIAFVKAHHYSGKVASVSRLHLGVFLDERLHGCMQFGDPIDKRKVISLVSGTHWRGFFELNRMAFDDELPRNSESRALSIAFRMIRKNAPHIKWIVSFADGTQCGDGTIYRAAGFVLTGITPNKTMYRLPSGEVIADVITRQVWNDSTRKKIGFRLGETWSRYRDRVGAERLHGFQLRYIYFLDPAYKDRLTVPILPFSEIERRGAKMYKGQKPGDTGETDNAPQSNAETGGASPTVSLLQVTE